MTEPLVSFVIPTRNRPEQVARAVTSALAQAYSRIEVIVVVDGPDAATMEVLKKLASPALHVVALPTPVGGSEARNLGVQRAAGDWIALLDDDDEALPRRIELQLARALNSRFTLPVLSSRLIAVREDGERIFPQRLYRGGDPAGYLFLRRSFRYGDGLLHTSTLLLPRKLLLACPFERGLRRHQDWDLVLRISNYPGAGIEMVAEPLARVFMQAQRASVSSGRDWKFSLQWARERAPRLGRRAYAAFLATECLPRAAKAGASSRDLFALVRESLCAAWFSPHVMLLVLAFYGVALKTTWRERARSYEEESVSPPSK